MVLKTRPPKGAILATQSLLSAVWDYRWRDQQADISVPFDRTWRAFPFEAFLLSAPAATTTTTTTTSGQASSPWSSASARTATPTSAHTQSYTPRHAAAALPLLSSLRFCFAYLIDDIVRDAAVFDLKGFKEDSEGERR